MTTIKDIAKVAGVSFATVARALRGEDGVSPETRDRVLQVAGQMDYLRSPAAASLASGRSRLIAVVTPFLSSWVSTSLIAAISAELGQHGHQAIPIDLTDLGREGRRRLTAGMLRNRVDGIITLNVCLDDDELGLVDRLRLPLVAVGSHVPGRFAVGIDDATTTRTATEYLIGLGHSRIAYVGPLPDRDARAATTLLRLQSFMASLHDHGLRTPQLVAVEGDCTARAAADAIKPILQLSDRPSAVFAASDEMAFGVLQTARWLGLNVPNDLSIIGIDDHALAGVMDLTTMRQDLNTQGRLASTMLLRSLTRTPGAIENVVVPTELIVRGSAATPRPDN